ncbi:hypothetical protein J2T58_001977 [Methanocalculus alkaliphilus]|uniref:hypothetical protein n=1 Tax=Methanocalculus alkaliphilus TaxID=768730 RepID=UPI0020A13538|nr:hypothetical protein [Methanocalculus alkaliphilus]MCP1716102.1 hypothetical protein [Methanocalculus alkaliphilus]
MELILFLSFVMLEQEMGFFDDEPFPLADTYQERGDDRWQHLSEHPWGGRCDDK